jgi:hypothetical protein
MKLYRHPQLATHWFAFDLKIGWVTFPAEVGGWRKRQPAQDIDLIGVQEVPIRLGFNTGIPGAAESVAWSSGSDLEVAA